MAYIFDTDHSVNFMNLVFKDNFTSLFVEQDPFLSVPLRWQIAILDDVQRSLD